MGARMPGFHLQGCPPYSHFTTPVLQPSSWQQVTFALTVTSGRKTTMSYQTEIIVDSQPGPLGPGAVFSVGALPGGAWSSELCDCCSDVGTCLCGALVPCILASRVSERFGQTCLLPCLPGALVALRTGIRERYRIEGSVCDDWLVMVCCLPCGLCQLSREQDARQ
ncbi:cornifelin homolog [Alligator mississippiensis]|uniref:cornifelin homolog n=1 Tax=Alligator mississippiensis TaxID=8496 RepID=UPI002877DCEC|nr:cornifelin homolog [Alligator mississippiensis]